MTDKPKSWPYVIVGMKLEINDIHDKWEYILDRFKKYMIKNSPQDEYDSGVIVSGYRIHIPNVGYMYLMQPQGRSNPRNGNVYLCWNRWTIGSLHESEASLEMINLLETRTCLDRVGMFIRDVHPDLYSEPSLHLALVEF